MKTAVIIPARYDSSRLKGKPLADICGRPMLWWVYSRVKKARGVGEVWAATDSPQVEAACREFHSPCLMTSSEHTSSTERVYEAARQIPAELYVCVNGDEPLIDPALVERIIPQRLEGFFAANLMTRIANPVEAVDDSNIKVVTDPQGYALFFSRSPIPHPKASIRYDFYKHLGILAYTLEALRFFAETPRGRLEAVEDINELRFLENGKRLRMIPVEAATLSVDTPKDLEYVRAVVEEKLKRGELKL